MLDAQSNGCLTCGGDKGSRPMFCSRTCSVRNATKNRGPEDTYRYYSKTPRNFFQSLLQKKSHDRADLSLDYLVELWDSQEGLCAVSGVPMTHMRGKGKVMTNVSIDRIDSDIGYVRGNIQLVCYVVNIMKHTLTLTELVWWCDQILDTSNNKMSNLKVQSQAKNRSFARNKNAGRKK